MVRAIQRMTEADKEWRFWKEELAKEKVYKERVKEHALWQQTYLRHKKEPYLVDVSKKNAQSPPQRLDSRYTLV
jgi:hypothetical protein